MASSLIARRKLRKVYKVLVLISLIKVCIIFVPGLMNFIRESEMLMKALQGIPTVDQLDVAELIFIVWVNLLLLSFVLFWELYPLTGMMGPESEVDRNRIWMWATVHFLLGMLYVMDCGVKFYAKGVRSDTELSLHGLSVICVSAMMHIAI
ncbi:unnamed protein product [Orchesella dallaii]|uniref:Transmembrane protein n=1 Tax=Orchesella dallaii TaxID=48710 RepID=A0ABP1Q0W5_9HEXA